MDGQHVEDAEDMVLALLERRAKDATICPSEVARALTSGDDGSGIQPWRDAMPLVHAAIDAFWPMDGWP